MSRRGLRDGYYYQSEYGPRSCAPAATATSAPRRARARRRLPPPRVRAPSTARPSIRLGGGPNVFASAHRYLLESAAALWRLDEVSWNALVPLFASSTRSRRGPLRHLPPLRRPTPRDARDARPVFSPLQLDMLRDLRDYRRRRSMLAAFFLGGLLRDETFPARGLAILERALAGLVLGIGLRLPGRRARRSADPRRRDRSVLAGELANVVPDEGRRARGVVAFSC